jgi:hypothetical protein
MMRRAELWRIPSVAERRSTVRGCDHRKQKRPVEPDQDQGPLLLAVDLETGKP